MSTKILALLVTTLFCALLIRFITVKQVEYRVGEVRLERTLLTEPKLRGTTQQFWIDGKILVVAPRFPEYHYGDTLLISGTLEGKVLGKRGTIITAYFPSIEIRQKKQNSLLSLTSFIRQHMKTTVSSTLPSTSASLLLGILLGVKEDMPSTFFEALRNTGTLHVVAASGMNVAIIGGFLFGITTRLLRRQIALLVSVAGIFLYAAIAGFEPSIVRASIMGGLAFGAQMLGRQDLPIFALVLAGFSMLMFAPLLLFDIGFQLSFFATAGLITLKPVFDAKVRFDSFTITLAAQLTTLPILLANFGSFSLLSILANTLVLWTVPLIMAIGGIAVLLGFVMAPLGMLTLIVSLPFLLFFEAVVSFFGKLPGVVTIEEFPIILGAGYYLVLLSIVMIWRRRN